MNLNNNNAYGQSMLPSLSNNLTDTYCREFTDRAYDPKLTMDLNSVQHPPLTNHLFKSEHATPNVR